MAVAFGIYNGLIHDSSDATLAIPVFLSRTIWAAFLAGAQDKFFRNLSIS